MANVPIVTTQTVTNIMRTTATGRGTIEPAEINTTESVSFGTTKLITNNPPRAESVVITNV